MTDVFLSYAREDKELVRPYVSALEGEGLTVWWDERIEGGDPWHAEVESNLTEARCVLTFWTAHSLKSEFVKDEARRASQRGVLIHIRLEQNGANE